MDRGNSYDDLHLPSAGPLAGAGGPFAVPGGPSGAVLVDAVGGAVAVGEAGAEGVALALPGAHPRLRRQHHPAVAAVQVYYTRR